MVLPIIPFLATAATAITTFVASVGPAIAAYATKVAPLLVRVAQTAGPILKEVINVAQVLLPLMNGFNKDDKVEDIGERALQAAEESIVLDEFDDFDDYLEELRNFELDPEKAEQRDPLVQQITGLGLCTIGLEEKFDLNQGNLSGLWLLPAGDAKYFTPSRLEDLLTKGQLVGNIFDYLSNQLTASDARDFEKKLEAGMSTSETQALHQALDNTKANLAKLEAI